MEAAQQGILDYRLTDAGVFTDAGAAFAPLSKLTIEDVSAVSISPMKRTSCSSNRADLSSPRNIGAPGWRERYGTFLRHRLSS